jgi:cell division protein FtsQ
MNERGQGSFSFSRPPGVGSPAARRRPRRGRIRLVLKQVTLLVFLTSVPAFGWAWHQGHVEIWRQGINQRIAAATVDAGFALERVRAEGQVRTSDEAILEALGLKVKEPMYGLDVTALKDRIEALPWVREAVVSRELPDTLKVWVKERMPFARWQIGGKLVLVDETAAIIAGPDLREFLGLPFIVGPGAPEAAAELFSVLAAEPELAARVVSAIRVGNRRWDLEFDTGMRLKLPEQSKTHGPAAAWRTFAEMEAEKGILNLEVMTIDLRLADRMVMKLTPEGRKLYENMDQET